MIDAQTIKNIVRTPLILFAALCLVTSLIINVGSGELNTRDSVLASGGSVGPLHIKDPDTVLKVKVQQDLPYDHWSFVTLELLDDQKQYLTGFGDEFWAEDGYDSDGYYWHESEKTYEARVTVPKAGDYFLQVKPQNNLSGGQERTGRIYIEVKTAALSPIPHLAGGMIAIIAWFLLGFLGGSTPLSTLREH